MNITEAIEFMNQVEYYEWKLAKKGTFVVVNDDLDDSLYLQARKYVLSELTDKTERQEFFKRFPAY